MHLDKERGSLEPGKLADISAFDVRGEYAINPSSFQSKSRNTCFKDWIVKGKAVHVWVSGRQVLRSGEVLETDS